MSFSNFLIGGTVAVAVGAWILRLRRTSAQLETVVWAKLHSLTLSGVTIRVDVQIKNPTAGTMAIKFPFVKIIYKGSTVGTSQVKDTDITIPSYGEVAIEGIMITIPVLGLLSLGADLIKSLSDTSQGVKLLIKTLTTIDLGFKSVPYEKNDEIVLREEPK